MKKILALALAVLMTAAILSVGAFADGTNNVAYQIPKANTAPTIDGVISGDEWDGALVRTLTADTVTAVSGDIANFHPATFYWMWDDAGMYLFAHVDDTTDPGSRHNQGDGSYNSLDGIQVCCYANTTLSGSDTGTLFFFSLVPTTNDGTPAIGEHFVYGTGSAGADVPEAKIASKMNGTAYDIEAFIPKEVWAKSTPAIDIKEGCVLPLANIEMDSDGTTQSLFTDTAWFDGTLSNTYTLVSTPAGHVETAAPETTAAPAAADTAAAAADTAADTAAAPATTAAQTGDMAIAAVIALITAAAAGYVVSKKK